MWEKMSTQTRVLVVLVGLMIGAALYGWYSGSDSTTQKEFVQAPPISGVASVPKHEVAVPKLKVYDKPALGKKVNLPQDVLSSSSKQVTATATTPPSKRGHDIISVTDTETGESSIHIKEKPLSLVGFENQKRIGVGYGVGTSSKTPEVKVYGEWTFFRVGNAYVSVEGEANNKAEAKAFAKIDYRF